MIRPSPSTCQASKAPASRACCLPRTLGISAIDLISHRCHRMSGIVTTPIPSSQRRGSGRRLSREVTTRHGLADFGNACSRGAIPRVIWRYTVPVSTPLRRTTSRRTILSAASPIGVGDAQLVKRTVQPPQMRFLVHQLSAAHRDDLVDAVRELISAVLDMDRGLTVRDVGSRHIGDAGHRRLSIGRARFAAALRPAVPRRALVSAPVIVTLRP